MQQEAQQSSDSSLQKSTKQSMNKTKNIQLNVVTLTVVVILSMSAGFVGGLAGSNSQSQSTTPKIEEGRQVAREQSNLISTLAEQVGPSVVSIDVTSQARTNGFFGPAIRQQQSTGTGFIISENGYVITNRHVIPNGISEVNLTMYDGTVIDKVSVVGRTGENDPLDIAFLKINDTKGKKLTVAKIGDSSKMKVGDTVVAIGNALGQFQNSVTSGIISGYGRTIAASDGEGNAENLQNLFQTDAAINQGNSGGPLVNANGEVIGINTAIAGDGAQNIGFSIPINDAKGLIASVVEKGKLERPYLGVQYIQLNPARAKELNASVEQGAYITDSNGNGVVKDSPADKAGLRSRDIIIKINDQEVNNSNTLASVIGRFKVGETVMVTFIRDGKQQTTTVTIGSLPTN